MAAGCRSSSALRVSIARASGAPADHVIDDLEPDEAVVLRPFPNGDRWYQTRKSETGRLLVRAQGESTVRRPTDRYRHRRVSEWMSSTSRALSALATDWSASFGSDPANCTTQPL